MKGRFLTTLFITMVVFSLMAPAHADTAKGALTQRSPGQSLGIALGITAVPNLRDVGGYETRDGAVVAIGRVYRSDAFHPMRPADIQKIEQLGLKNDYDLRTTAEVKVKPDQMPSGVRYHLLNVLADATSAAPAQLEALLHQPQYTPNLLFKSESRKTTFEKMVGGSPKMREIYRQIRQAASTDMPVLLTGETGTGKDLVARAIHQQSARNKKAFSPIHLGALPPELVAGELFGYEKGSFTGATRSHRGLFEKAEGGTIFLDEIGTIDEKIQISLLRLLETRKLERIGGTRTISANVRIVAATNENLSEAVEQGRFREDLFFRLDIFQIVLPPVRERGGDILLLVNCFLKQFSDDYQRDIVGISPECISALESYDWPGNVREIKNVIHRAVLNSSGSVLLPVHLPERLQKSRRKPPEIKLPMGCSLEEAEQVIIKRTLNWTRNNRRRTASILGISRRTLYNKLERYNLL